MDVNVSPVSPFNTFTVSSDDTGRIYNPGTYEACVKARAAFIKGFKDKGFTVFQNTVAINCGTNLTSSQMVDRLQAEERGEGILQKVARVIDEKASKLITNW